MLNNPSRRTLLASGIGLVAAGGAFPSFAQPKRATIEVVVDQPQNIISPDNFGYLLEVIGTSIYDGVWVGEEATIKNVGGIRKDVIDHLRSINASLIRWPGGCFAEAYDWRDGTGPRTQRPRRTSFWNDDLPKQVPNGPQRFDPNQFGTPEFMRLCQLSGGRPFLSANVSGLTPNDFHRWVEYCNSPTGSTTLADLRASDGSPSPFKVRHWGIGNEVWALGGDMTIEGYLELYKRFVSSVPDYGIDLAFIACGKPHGADFSWIEKLVEGVRLPYIPSKLKAISIHHYAGDPGNELAKGQNIMDLIAQGSDFPDASRFDESAWYGMLAHYHELEDYILRHWEVMAQVGDPQHEIKIAVDEWGAICKKGTELSPSNYWSRAVTLRDVVGAALTLDLLNRQSAKLALACFTGLINQEGGLFVTEGCKFLATGIYHVFKMYAAHQSGRLIPAHFDAQTIEFRKGAKSDGLWGLNGSASLKGKILTLTVVNPHVREPIEAEIRLRGGSVRAARLDVIRSDDIHAQNSFERPNTLASAPASIRASNDRFVHVFQPASINRLTLGLI